MSDKPISDLRRRMIADMTIRSFSEKTSAKAKYTAKPAIEGGCHW